MKRSVTHVINIIKIDTVLTNRKLYKVRPSVLHKIQNDIVQIGNVPNNVTDKLLICICSNNVMDGL